jgi:hypothetical protein
MKQPPQPPDSPHSISRSTGDPLEPAGDHLLAARGTLDHLIDQAESDARRREEAVERLIAVIAEVDPEAARRVRAAVRTAGMAHVRAARTIAAEALGSATLRAGRLAAVFADLVQVEAAAAAEAGLDTARRMADLVGGVDPDAAALLRARVQAAAHSQAEAGRALGDEVRRVLSGDTAPPPTDPARRRRARRRRRAADAANVLRLRRDEPPWQAPRVDGVIGAGGDGR